MSHQSIYDFSEWCYNRFVTYIRKHDTAAAFTILEVLRKHIGLNLKEKRFNNHRIYACSFLKKIDTAIKCKTVRQLPLSGKEKEEEDLRKAEQLKQILAKPDNAL